MADSFDSFNAKVNQIHQTVQKASQSNAFDSLAGKIQGIHQSVNAVTQSRSLTTVSNQLDKFTRSLDSLASGGSLMSLAKQIDAIGISVTKSIGKMNSSSLSLSVQGGNSLAELPVLFGQIEEKMPSIREQFSLLRAEISKTSRSASTFGSSLKATLDADLRNPLTNFEESMTEMFSPQGSLYSAMDNYFSQLQEKMNGLKMPSPSGGRGGSGSGSGSGSGGSNGGSGGSSYSPIIYGNSFRNELLADGFMALANAAQNAAQKIDQAVTTLNYVPDTLGVTTTSPFYKNLLKSLSSEYRQYDKQHIYSQNQEATAFNLSVAGGARSQQAITSMFGPLLELEANGYSPNPSMASNLYQVYQRNGAKSLNQFIATLFKVKQLPGVVNGGANALSDTLSNSNLFLGTGKNAGTGLSQMLLANALTESTGASASSIDSVFSSIYGMSSSEVSQLQQMFAPGGSNIMNMQSSINKGQYVKVLEDLAKSFNQINKSPNSSMIASALGFSNYADLRDIANSGGLFSKNSSTVNSLLSSGILTSPQSQSAIQSHQAAVIASHTTLPSKLASMAGASPAGQGALFLGQNGFNGNPINASDIVDGVASVLGVILLGKSFGSSGLGGTLGKIFGKISSKVLSKFGKGGLLGSNESAGGSSSVGGLGGGLGARGSTEANPVYVWVVNNGGNTSEGAVPPEGGGSGELAPGETPSTGGKSGKGGKGGGLKNKIKSKLPKVKVPKWVQDLQGLAKQSGGYLGGEANPFNLPSLGGAGDFAFGGGPTLTSGYGTRLDPISGFKGFHPGVDISYAAGTSLRSPVAGTVGASAYNPVYGNYVALNGSDGITRIFGHASKLAVRAGQSVQAGQIVGSVGSTGRSTGSHLHYETRIGGMPVNPMGGPTYPSSIAQWLPQMQQASSLYGVPVPILAGVMNQESGGTPGAYSPAGAIGLMQLEPGTAMGLGVNPYDPTQNIMGGAKYLASLYSSFHSWPLALAGYNAGGGSVSDWVKQYGSSWSAISSNLTGGYLQTKAYVPDILSWINNHGGMSGLNISAMLAQSQALTSGSGWVHTNQFASTTDALERIAGNATTTNYQANLAQALLGSPSGSGTVNLSDVVTHLKNIKTQLQEANGHLAEHKNVAKMAHRDAKKMKQATDHITNLE